MVEEYPGDQSAPINLVRTYRCPVLGLFGGADPKITPEHAAAFRRALGDAGVAHDIVAYSGAPHSFFDRTFIEHERAARDAWRRMLRFIGSA